MKGSASLMNEKLSLVMVEGRKTSLLIILNDEEKWLNWKNMRMMMKMVSLYSPS